MLLIGLWAYFSYMISVVVPTYNEEKFIRLCLNALKNQSLPGSEYEVIVSDSSSTDSTVKIAKQLADRVVKCKKVSAGFGRNQGAKAASGDWIAFLDADSFASKTWLEGVKEATGKKKVVGATGPFTALPQDSFVEKIFYRGWSLESWLTTKLGSPLLPGFNFAVQKQAFMDMGMFREDDMVCEDLDLSLRLRKRGKIDFNKKMLTQTSARRVSEMGVLSYSFHGLSYVLLKKKYTWSDHRPDW